MGEVVDFPGLTKGHVPPEKVLEGALKQKLDEVVVIGTKDGEFFMATSEGYSPDILWLIELARQEMLSTPTEVEDPAPGAA